MKIFSILFGFIFLLFFQENNLIAQIKNKFENKLEKTFALKSRGFEDFEVTFKENHFYFVDKKGIEIKKFGKWKEITEEDYVAFDFLKVKDDSNAKYLLDNDGNKYLFAESLAELTPKTEALEIRNTHLGKFPKEIFEIGKNLIFLCVDGTGIYEIPKEITNLKKLKFLDISNNSFFEMPNYINQLELLEKIDISICDFQEFPLALLGNKNLTFINLDISRITKFPLEELKTLKKLNTLLLEKDESKISKEYLEEIKKALPNCKFY